MMRLALLTVALLVLVGCGTKRTITITSEPSGALVHLNDEEIGRTPVTVPFTWHGTYDVRLEKEGHMPLWTQHATSDPLWEKPGLDIPGEIIGAKLEEKWHFVLKPRPEEAPEALVERAKQMRALTNQP